MRRCAAARLAATSLAALFAAALGAAHALAGPADVVAAEAQCAEGACGFSVTVRHADTGWDHYADAWEVLAPDGRVLATRTLHHPHVDEQPFTRSLRGVRLPDGLREVRVRARDSVHGFGGHEVVVTLAEPGDPAPAARTVDCHLLPVETPDDELAACASIGAGGTVALSEAARAAIARRGPGPVALSIDGAFHYALASGRAAPVLPFDNGADPFAEGLARTPQDGRIGFVDRALVVRIPPRWDFAFPFSGGTAVVCQGCSLHPAGEHTEVRGGLWGRIDREGREVVPARFPRDELPAAPAREAP